MWLGLSFFRMVDWLPSEWPELDQGYLRETLGLMASAGENWKEPNARSRGLGQEEDHRLATMRAATCLLWQQYLNGDFCAIDQLEVLSASWKCDYGPDEVPEWTRTFLKIHIDTALALYLHKNENGHSEALQEALERVTKLGSMLYHSDYLMEPGVYYQTSPRYFNDSVPLKRSLALALSLAWCMKFYIYKGSFRFEDAFDCAYWAFEQTDWIGTTSRFLQESSAMIEQKKVVAGLASVWLRGQEVADVVDEVCNAVNPKTDWAKLSDQCDQMRYYYEQGYDWAEENKFSIDRHVRSRLGKIRSSDGSEWTPNYPMSEFWTFARGLCATRLSPDAYMKLRQDEEDHAAERRLKTYFFPDSWDLLPEASRQNLITADRIYWSQEGNRGSLASSLRLTVEPILEKYLVGPYHDWQKTTGKSPSRNPRRNDREPFTPISVLLRVWQDDPKTFRQFTGEAFGELADAFWNGFQQSLYFLRHLRGAVEHPEDNSEPTENEISSCYRMWVGIGERSLISEILLLSNSDKQAAKRH